MNKGVAKRLSARRVLSCGCALLVPFFAASAPVPATNATVDSQSPEVRAADAEREGRIAEAVAAYEALLEKDTASESVVAPRLVALHVRLGQQAQALSWAARVARRHPYPAAYLAGVHAQLGQFKDAEMALRQALRDSPDAGRRLPLLWQLAEVQEKQGDRVAARNTLHQSRDAAATADQRQASGQRLDALRQRLQTAVPAKAPPLDETRKGEATP